MGVKDFHFCPPVCHLKLGDSIHHDIIINSISRDYTDVPWALETGSVQPMFALVTMSFNIVGPYGGSEKPLTASNSKLCVKSDIRMTS